MKIEETKEQLKSSDKTWRNMTWAEMTSGEQIAALRDVVRSQNERIRNLESSVRLLTIHGHDGQNMVTIPFAHEHIGICRSKYHRILE